MADFRAPFKVNFLISPRSETKKKGGQGVESNTTSPSIYRPLPRLHFQEDALGLDANSVARRSELFRTLRILMKLFIELDPSPSPVGTVVAPTRGGK